MKSKQSRNSNKRPTPKEQKAIDHFIVNRVQIDAYRHAYTVREGTKDGSVRVRAVEVFRRPHVKRAVAKALAAASQEAVIDAAYVLRRHAEIDQMDAADIIDDNGSVLPIRTWPKIWRQYISGFDVIEIAQGGDKAVAALKKIKWPDKVRNLELLGKHVDVGAYRERTEVTGANGGPIETVMLDPKEYAKARQQMLTDDDC